jgi:hypothetical protein
MTEKDELDLMLERWNHVPASDPQLKQHVWTRIAAESAEQTFSLRNALERVNAFLSRPVGAGIFVATSIILGLILAEFRIAGSKSAKTEELAKSYIQLIDKGNQANGEEALR